MENEPLNPTEPEISLATTADLAAILELQQKNLARNVTEDEKQQQGFVSVETSPELLGRIATDVGITVAKIDGQVVGYLIPMTLNHAQEIPLLAPFIAQFPTVTIDNIPLSRYRYCVLGQVCIAKEMRGKGILEKLYAEMKQRLAGTYDIGISEIGANNPRSLAAHQDKIGLKVAQSYSAEGRDWHIVYLDFRTPDKLT